MSTATRTELDRTRIKELTLREEERLNSNTQKSKETFERAREHLSGGVASSYQLREPWPIYMESGVGPKVSSSKWTCLTPRPASRDSSSKMLGMLRQRTRRPQTPAEEQ